MFKLAFINKTDGLCALTSKLHNVLLPFIHNRQKLISECKVQRSRTVLYSFREVARRFREIDCHTRGLRPGSYVAFLPCRMQFTRDYEANHLIIYYLNCIRHRRNAAHEQGLSCVFVLYSNLLNAAAVRDLEGRLQNN